MLYTALLAFLLSLLSIAPISFSIIETTNKQQLLYRILNKETKKQRKQIHKIQCQPKPGVTA
jgi:hypothetical protein